MSIKLVATSSNELLCNIVSVNDETSTINEKPAKKIVSMIRSMFNLFQAQNIRVTEHEHGSPNFDDDPRIKKIHVP
ncbi:unnamed protein product [Rotaria magnacalcarata]|uniref:Uncharacterized protein n=1 Tax=Rotaria magnacalcarata TaxID=392030 RepID=A0A816NUY1_9BILA|nr:unnamed protein product [Rotaria magnacalcarata]